MKVIFGIGNPGSKYNNTRHNIGFAIIDYIVKLFLLDKPIERFNSLIYTKVLENNEKILLVKPLTYVNLSGKALLAIKSFYRIKNEDILVISDDISFSFESFKVKKEGGDGGHNGLKSINQVIGKQFARIKVGIANDLLKQIALDKFVLSQFSKEESNQLEPFIKAISEVVIYFFNNNIEKTMNKFNKNSKEKQSSLLLQDKFSKILIASGNTHKVREIKDCLTSVFKKVVSFNDLNLKELPKEPKENGETFYDNALIKAKAMYEYFKIPSLADDSGLIVEVLNNQPGIHSKRFAGEKASDLENNKKLLEILKDVSNRKAFFTTVMVLYWKDKNGKENIIKSQGIIYGEITKDLQGNQGFGYDPIFLPKNYRKTFAEITQVEKNKISHRGIALRNLVKEIKKIH